MEITEPVKMIVPPSGISTAFCAVNSWTPESLQAVV
jgi:hypothetical protein